jgi:hypothetical protein
VPSRKGAGIFQYRNRSLLAIADRLPVVWVDVAVGVGEEAGHRRFAIDIALNFADDVAMMDYVLFHRVAEHLNGQRYDPYQAYH